MLGHSLSSCYHGWASYQQRLVTMLAPLSPEQLAFPTAAHHRAIGMVVQHMIADRVWWFQLWMGEGSPELAPLMRWDPAVEPEPPARAAAELVAGLEATWEMISGALVRWTVPDLAQVFSPPTVLSAAEQQAFGDLTRQWIIWHVLEHEIHHGGELSLALGGYGLAGIYGNA